MDSSELEDDPHQAARSESQAMFVEHALQQGSNCIRLGGVVHDGESIRSDATTEQQPYERPSRLPLACSGRTAPMHKGSTGRPVLATHLPPYPRERARKNCVVSRI